MNSRAEIRVDTQIEIELYRPDLFVYDEEKNEIRVVEIEITCQDQLAQKEAEKIIKYDCRANELKAIYKAKVYTMPYAIMWDGVVTKCFVKNILKHTFKLKC